MYRHKYISIHRYQFMNIAYLEVIYIPNSLRSILEPFLCRAIAIKGGNGSDNNSPVAEYFSTGL